MCFLACVSMGFAGVLWSRKKRGLASTLDGLEVLPVMEITDFRLPIRVGLACILLRLRAQGFDRMEVLPMRGLMLGLLLLALPSVLWAKPDVHISVEAKRQIVVEEDGKKVVKLVEAKDVQPGDVLVYQLHYENRGDSAAKDARLVNPIPENTVYIDGSAFGSGAEIEFSIDGGKTYKKPSLLTYQADVGDGKTEARVASPEQYTHIRWTVREIPAGKSGMASFQVRVR